MSEETPPDGPWPDDRAVHRYELVAARAPAVERGLRFFGSLVWGFATAGGDVNPGGGRVLIRDRTSGSTVATFVQGWGDSLDMAHT